MKKFSVIENNQIEFRSYCNNNSKSSHLDSFVFNLKECSISTASFIYKTINKSALDTGVDLICLSVDRNLIYQNSDKCNQDNLSFKFSLSIKFNSDV